MMKLQNKILIFTILSGILISGQALAQSNLEVDFQNEPLFSESNFLPSESISKWIKVANNSGENQIIIIEAINQNDSDDFSEAIDFQISNGTNILFDDTLSAFFNAGEVNLGDISDQETIQYDLSANFVPESENNYQGLSLGFDILIGFAGTEDQETDNPGGGGGGGGTSLPGLSILKESVKITDIQETSVTITWNTSYLSTSQVVYSEEGEQHDFDIDGNNFGYAHAHPDPEDFTKVTGHSVTITGLSPSTTYYFRCVSHASPPSVSTEHKFTTNNLEIIVSAPETEEMIPESEEETIIPISETTEEIEEIEEVAEPEIEEINEVSQEEPIPFLAAIGNILGNLWQTCYMCLPWWLLLIFAAYLAMWGVLHRKKNKKKSNKWFIISSVLLIISLIFYGFNYKCVAMWVFFLIVLAVLALWRLWIISRRDVRGRIMDDKYLFFGTVITLILLFAYIIIQCLPLWIIIIGIIIYLILVNIKKRKKNILDKLD